MVGASASEEDPIALDVSAIRRRAGVLRRSDVRTLRVTGTDRVRFLNGMLTNDVARLAPGEGMLAVKCTHRGRVQGVLRVRCTEEALFLDLLAVAAPKVTEALLSLIVMDEVDIQDCSEERAVLGLYGPHAAGVLEASGLWAGAPPAGHGFAETAQARVIAEPRFGVPGFEIHVPSSADAGRVLRALTHSGAQEVTPEALNVLRVEAGFPWDGSDIDEDTIPMEARLEEAINLEKGCFLGQEVIARATNLGGIKHILVGVAIDGVECPPPGAVLYRADPKKETGELCSVVWSPTLKTNIALGYVRKADDAPGTLLWIDHGQGLSGRVVPLPFV